MMRVLIMAGGTGGHVFPGLSIAKALQSAGVEVFWLGTKQGLEARLVPEAQIPLFLVRAEGLRGKRGVFSRLSSLFRSLRTVWACRRILRRLRPDRVLSMGGYVGGYGGIAALSMHLPLFLHEQNTIPGLSNRLLAPFAKRIFCAFSHTFPAKHRQVWVVGNPVREELTQLPVPLLRYSAQEGPLRVLVLGGSQGASILNEVLPQALAKIDPRLSVEVWHQCGEKHEQETIQNYANAGVRARIAAFIPEMAQAYAWADLVVCRSGALTISELCVVGVASVLVPFPYAADNHQVKNAQFMADRGAAVCIPQKDFCAEGLASLLAHVHRERGVLQQAATQAYALRHPFATDAIASQLTTEPFLKNAIFLESLPEQSVYWSKKQNGR